MKFLELNTNQDFPFYKHNPRISRFGWFILLLMIPVSFLLYGIFGIFSEFLGSIIFCFSLLIPLLYFSNWNYSLMFKKPSRNEIVLAILMFIGYIAYSFLIDYILVNLGFSYPNTTAYSEEVNIIMIVSLIFSMMGEELTKFIPLMFFLRVFYKYSNNRKLSIFLSSIIVLIGFGLLHYEPGVNTLVSVLLIQGLGSIFEVYSYLKTKNIFVPYMSHLITDAVIFILIFIGF